MSFSSLCYDSCKLSQDTVQSTSVAKFYLDQTAHIHCETIGRKKVENEDDSKNPWGLKRDYRPAGTDLESELLGLTRRASKCSSSKYNAVCSKETPWSCNTKDVVLPSHLVNPLIGSDFRGGKIAHNNVGKPSSSGIDKQISNCDTI